jgi:hypothetical protein
MDVPQLKFGDIKFPGAAGAHQAQGSTASLVRELGDNYHTYHDFLAQRLAKLGRPRPENFKSYEAYAQAWTQVEQIVEAEVALRACRGFRKFGGRLNAPAAATLVDANDRLVPDPR